MQPFSAIRHPASPQSKKGKRRVLEWRPRTSEEIQRKKNRKVISQHLKRIGKAAGRELSLDRNGVCVFSFKKFVVVVEVPEVNSDIVVFYSKICHLGPEDNREEVERFVNLYNSRQASNSSSQEVPDISSGSESTCPGVDPHSPYGTRLELKDEEEVHLCLSLPIQGLSFQTTADKLEFFIKTAVAANRKLRKVKGIPPPVRESEQVLKEEAPPSPSVARRLRIWSVDSQTSVSNASQTSIFSLFTPTCSTTSS